LCFKVTNPPYNESEQGGKQGNSDHERPDREAESALTGSFNHACSRIAPGKELRVNHNVGILMVSKTSGSEEGLIRLIQSESIFSTCGRKMSAADAGRFSK
jgi:hypothetical protein